MLKTKDILTESVSLADLLKVSDEEMTLITGEKDLEAGTKKLASMGPRLYW